ncbi:MAG TPA: aldehyde dehydrogenase family protein [Actinomycetota bacterium]
MTIRPFYVAGEPRTGGGTFDVTNPADGSVIATVGRPSRSDVEDALRIADETFRESQHLPAHARIDALTHISRRIEESLDELSEMIAREGGKPLKWARSEASRAVSTFRIAAEEVRRFGGELLRLDTEEALGARLAIVRRFPFGAVLGISPFNFPLNLVAHKVAPALAVGAPIVLKPAEKTPLSALKLAELVYETALPHGMMSVLTVDGPTAEQLLVPDMRLPKITFTGSSEVGWKLRKVAPPQKRITLELGGNAGVIVHSDADLDHAAQRIAIGGYYQAGQSCISVQRILVQSEVYDSFSETLVKHVSGLKTGDTMDPSTDVGPLINADALERIAAWVDEAKAGGARVLCGGTRHDPFYDPTVLADVTLDMKVCREEVFGPVTSLIRYQTFEEALEIVNDSAYGLQAGVFTKDIARAFQAHREIRVGGLLINDQSAFRADQMPYGGAKESGVGREGPRYAMEEMTEPRIMVISNIPL